MKKCSLIVVLVLLIGLFLSCAAKIVNIVQVNDETLSKKVIVTGIPTELNGLYGDISLAIYNENNTFNWIAWSKPVIIKNSSEEINLLIINESGNINELFCENGIFIVFFKIDYEDNQGLPVWQGYIFEKSINDENTVLLWSEFEEANG
ncbi:MAG: hypothetical protein LBH43_11710 [Treponema sp.]|jgi:hypothetical protein|nr:hypothetical protein [Treponema sp.]